MRKIAKKDVENITALTPMQEGMLFHYLKDPDCEFYHNQLRIDVCGVIQDSWFRQSWHEVIQNNEILRTVFRWENVNNPLQIVLKHNEPNVHFVNIAHTQPDCIQEVLAKEMQADQQRKFELHGVPFRIRIYQTTDNSATMLISNHHILFDGWSSGIIVKEFMEAYDRAARQEKLPLRHKAPFSTFIKWLQAQEQQKQKGYWMQYLSDLGEKASLSIAKRERVDSHVAESVQRHLSREMKQLMENYAAEQSLSVSSILISVWGCILQRYKNSDDVLFGTTVSGRTPMIAGCEDMVGLFINTVPFRSRHQKGSVAAYIQSVNKELLTRQQYESASIVDIKQYAGVEHSDELFDTVMVIENYPLDQRLKSQQGTLTIQSHSMREFTNYDLLVSVELSDDMNIQLHYNSFVYEQVSIENMLDHFIQMISEAVQHPEKDISSLEMVTAQEKQILLYDFNQTDTDRPSIHTIPALFEAQVEKTPDHTAIVDGASSMTYRALNERANQVAHLLRDKGIKYEETVGILMERSTEMIIAILGILKACGAYVPVDPSYPHSRVSYILKDSGARFLVQGQNFLGEQGHYTGEIINIHDEQIQRYPIENVSDSVQNVHHLAYVMYTSGSTGEPKGVMIEHRNVVNLIHWFIRHYQIDENTRLAFTTNLVFDPSVEQIFATLLSGASIHCISQSLLLDAESFLQYVEKHQFNIIDATPSLLRELFPSRKAIGIQTIIAGGELLNEELKNQILASGFELVNAYGPTETTVDTLTARCETDKPVVLGKPIDNVSVYIMTKHGELQPVGVVGELCISGAGVGRGYINRPSLTAEKFVPDPFREGRRMFRTGDLAKWNSDGSIEYIGRQDFQVKINGVRIEMEEIQLNLHQHPQIRDVIVMQRLNKFGEPYIAAYYVSDSHELKHESLTQFMKEKLPRSMIPSYFVALDKIPLGANGKPDRSALPDPADNREDSSKTYVLPEKGIEDAIASIWKKSLGLTKVGAHDNFFDIGGNSLKLIRVFGNMRTITDKEVTISDMFAYPTISSLANYLAGEEQKEIEEGSIGSEEQLPAIDADGNSETEIAIIGMAGRFPGASNIDQFWMNLQQGVESIHFYSDEELGKKGVASEDLSHPGFVNTSGGVMPDREMFDADFFGYSPREAELMDPQIRVLHECVWEALEHAGYVPDNYSGSIGLYAGSSDNLHWTQMVLDHKGSSIDKYKTAILTGKDFLCTNISYKLNMRGPSYTVQTGCSTSLVAVVNACRALIHRECDMAVAGGVSIYPDMPAGYIYQEGMIFSPDGHCRAFDEQAQGTVPGEGAGVVVLKRLSAAMKDGDFIHAIIKGTSINNDGSRKVGYTAPSIEGQTDVIRAAQVMAKVPPESISYVEAHGTATTLGDPVELTALKRAFDTQKTRYCAIGSVKTNIGHLDAAAGIAGLIKTVHALKHKQIPGNLHYNQPTKKFDFVNSPFYVNRSLTRWEQEEGPLRAGVSSFGIGGTNAHVVLEESPTVIKEIPSNIEVLLPLSALTSEALEQMSNRLAEYIRSHPEVSLAHVAYTLQVGRKAFPYRRSVVCATHTEAVERLTAADVKIERTKSLDNPLPIFMFPGQGVQRVQMGLELYESDLKFREEIDRCFDIFDKLGAGSIRQIMYPENELDDAAEKIVLTEYAQPVIFVFEYALARLLMARKIVPQAMIGHSLGEYVAACISGVLSIEDTLRLVVARGKLMQTMEPGAMVSVPLTREEVLPLLEEGLSLAAVNGPRQCVVSGNDKSIEKFEYKQLARGLVVKRLNTSHAFHSQSADAILGKFEEELRKVNFHPPKIPYISNLSGNWISVEEATDPQYWMRHLRETVNFNEGLEKLLEMHEAIFIEVGPDRTLSSLVNRRKREDAGHRVTSMMSIAKEAQPGLRELLELLGNLWAFGLDVKWNEHKANGNPLRVPLPTYPFERKPYWPHYKPVLEATKLKDAWNVTEHMNPPDRNENMSDWFYTPSWERLENMDYSIDFDTSAVKWLLFADDNGICSRLGDQIRIADSSVVTVTKGTGYRKLNQWQYIIHPERLSDYQALFKDLLSDNQLPDHIVHFWSIPEKDGSIGDIERLDHLQQMGFYSCISIAQTIGSLHITKNIHVTVVTSDMHEVTGEEQLSPEQATVLGFVKICPLEYPNISCQSIDLTATLLHIGSWTERIIQDMCAVVHQPVLAYRHAYRWAPVYRKASIDQNSKPLQRFREGKVYMITGGLRGIGLELAKHVATQNKVRLVLVGRSPFPRREDWSAWIEGNGEQDSISCKIREIQNIESSGTEVMAISADLARLDEMKAAFAKIEATFGNITGVIHAAGVADYEGVIQHRTKEMSEKVLVPKVKGTIILDSLLDKHELDFFVLFSSNGNISHHYKFGQVAYNAANEFLDAYACYKNAVGSTHTISINWCDWKDVGMSVEAAAKWSKTLNISEDALLRDALTIFEGTRVFDCILNKMQPRIIVSPVDLHAEMLFEQQQFQKMLASTETRQQHQEPGSNTGSLDQTLGVRNMLIDIWTDLLGKENLDVNDNVFELGANSLDIIQVNSRLNAMLKREIPLVTMYTYPTIQALSQYLESGEQSQKPQHNEQQDAKLSNNKKVMNNTLAKFKKQR